MAARVYAGCSAQRGQFVEQFAYVINLTRPEAWSDPNEFEAGKVREHFAYLQGHLAAGRLIIAGRVMTPGGFGIIVFEAEDEDAAQRLMESDPAVAAGVMRAELHPFRVALLRGETG